MTGTLQHGQDVSPGAADAPIHPPWSSTTLSVLYVEDEDLPAEVVQYILHRGNPRAFAIERVTSVRDAVEQLGEKPYDVILLDLNLPDIAGWTTFQVVRRHAAEAAIVILTGDPDTEIARRAVQEGAQDYLYKHQMNTPGLLERVLCYAAARHQHQQSLRRVNRRLEQRNQDLQRLMQSLEATQLALVESEKVKSMGQMAAGIAHEIKNPLAILEMGLEYLQGAAPDRLPAARDKVLPDLLSALERAAGIVNEMLDYAAPRALQVEAANLNDVVQEAVNLMSTSFHGHGISTAVSFEETLPPIELDRTKMIQVLLNLITNALNAMEGAGRLDIRTLRARIPPLPGVDDGEDLPELAVVEIRDTGPGLPPEVADHIFDPFFTTRADRGGTGLGLPVCKMILDLHGARLEVGNHDEGGAVARISFVI